MMPLHLARRAAPHALLTAAALMALVPASAFADDNHYDLRFELRLTADQSRAQAAVVLTQDEPRLIEARFRAPAGRYDDFSGDGEIDRDGEFVTWRPPANGGRIQYAVDLDHRRANGKYDALVTRNWAIFRADKAFPPARVVHKAGARSRTTLRIERPRGWSLITPFGSNANGDYVVTNPKRAFDRPTGWLIAGRLGRRKDQIGDMEVSVAAPVGMGVERISMLALVRWTLPYLADEVGTLPPRISIVSAGDPMWRGGLSGPNSLYVHADRPLLSENGTSTLLHELVHVLMPLRTRHDSDWIDEGVAEYITLRLLLDSGTISPERFQKALDDFAARGRKIGNRLLTAYASGAVKARAVALFAELDTELIAATGAQADIYDLLRLVRERDEPLDITGLRSAAREITGTNDIPALAFEPARAP